MPERKSFLSPKRTVQLAVFLGLWLSTLLAELPSARIPLLIAVVIASVSSWLLTSALSYRKVEGQ